MEWKYVRSDSRQVYSGIFEIRWRADWIISFNWCTDLCCVCGQLDIFRLWHVEMLLTYASIYLADLGIVGNATMLLSVLPLVGAMFAADKMFLLREWPMHALIVIRRSRCFCHNQLGSFFSFPMRIFGLYMYGNHTKLHWLRLTCATSRTLLVILC